MRELEDARYKAIGARIRDVRIEKNMSQAELAEKAFISVPHMSEVENGKTKLRLSTFVYIMYISPRHYKFLLMYCSVQTPPR